MERQDRAGEEYSGDASGSNSGPNVREEDDFEESPPLPFPQRNMEHLTNSFHDVPLTERNNELSPSARNDSCSCVVIVLAFWLLAAMTMIFGVYAPEELWIEPNSSILINPYHLFVESVKVEELKSVKELMLYGFYKIPPLDVLITWSDSHKTTLPAGTHKEWKFYLNEGSQINISYSITSRSSSSLVLVIAQGSEGLDTWLDDPSYPNTTLSWDIIHGNGSVQKDLSKSSSYYVAVGNLNSEVVKVQLRIGIKALIYNTTEAYYQCTLVQGLCTFNLFLLKENAALITSPSRKSAMANGVKVTYCPRWITYFVGLGGLTALVLLVDNIFTRSQSDQDRRRDRMVAVGSEQTPFISHKDESNSSWGSSYVSVSEEEDYLEDSHLGAKESESSTRRLCAICFDAQRDCFFLPCGHSVACFECATRIAEASGTCPICRRHTKKVRKIYTV